MGLDNPLHIAFLLVLLLLVFGAKRLPEMGRSLGGGLRGFKDALSSEQPAVAPAPASIERAAAPGVSTPDATPDEVAHAPVAAEAERSATARAA